MVKHIGGQAIFQALVLFVFIFAGPYFIKEADVKDFENAKYAEARN
jgi:hypothetical protein